MNLNIFVGTLTDDKMPIFSRGDETFYLSHLDCRGVKLPVVVSQYYFEAYTGKRVECTAFMRTTRVVPEKKRSLFSYLYVVLIRPVGEDTDDDRRVEICGKITELSDIDLTPDNRVKREIKLEYQVQFGNVCCETVSCRCFDEVARITLSLEVGDLIKVSGYMTGGRRSLRLIVKELQKEKALMEVH